MGNLNRKAVVLIICSAVWLFHILLSSAFAADPEMISVDELKELLDSQDPPIVVDVRAVQSYKFGHIPGAISISVGEIDSRHEELPLDKTLVFY